MRATQIKAAIHLIKPLLEKLAAHDDVIANLVKLGLVEKREQFNAVGDNTSNLYIVRTIASAKKSPADAPHTPPRDACHSPPNASKTPPDAEDTPKLNSKNYIQINNIQSSIYQQGRA